MNYQQPSPFFDRRADKYQCCCGCMHVETGTKIICYLGIITQTLSVLASLFSGSIGSAIVALFFLLIVTGPVIGLEKNNPSYFIPYLVCLGLTIVGCVVQIPVYALGFDMKSKFGHQVREFVRRIFEDPRMTEETIYSALVAIIIYLVIATMFAVWFYSVIFKCYRYVQDRMRANCQESYVQVETGVAPCAPPMYYP